MKDNTEYETVIGLEIHVELATETKIFCGCSTFFGAAPNTHICPVCLGMPGALPVLNRQVVEDAIKVALALNCDINRETRFDRKNYYYPDNPQNYQISQLYAPIGVNGLVGNCRIHEIHMEEDAGKLIHMEDESRDTLIDYNRAGVPLIEIVTEPDMRSAEEVVEFLTKLRTMLRFLGVSDCRMNEGSLRADVNLSVRPFHSSASGIERADRLPPTYAGDAYGAFGTRTEMKNLNSFKAITRAIESEAKRQLELLEKGEGVEQETRRWDDEKGCSFLMRSKEDAKDYRYFPDPDLPPVHISDTWIDEVRKALPELPEEKAIRYKEEYGLSDYDIGLLTSEKALADRFEQTIACRKNRSDGKTASTEGQSEEQTENRSFAKKVANWLLGETLRIVNERGMEMEDITLAPEDLADLIDLTDSNRINSTTAKEIFGVIFDKKTDVNKYVEEHGLAMVSDASELSGIIQTVMDANPKSVADYHAGKTKAIGFLIGQVMKETKGKADPELVKELLVKRIVD